MRAISRSNSATAPRSVSLSGLTTKEPRSSGDISPATLRLEGVFAAPYHPACGLARAAAPPRSVRRHLRLEIGEFDADQVAAAPDELARPLGRAAQLEH